jgi:hypothetical protein
MVPRGATLLKIARATGTTVDWLLGGKQETESPRPVSHDQVVEAALAAFGAVLGPVDVRDRETIEEHLRTQMRILVEWALSRAPHGQIGQASRHLSRKEISPPSRRFVRRRASPRGGVRAK